MSQFLILDKDMIAYYQRRAAQAVENIKKIRREDCPRCATAHCEIAMKCTSRLDPDTETHGFDDGPMCRHVTVEETRRADAEVVAARLRRMESAGVPDPDVRAVMSRVRVMPTPPASWFGMDQERRKQSQQLVEGVHRILAAPEIRQAVISGGTGTGKSSAASFFVAHTLDNARWVPARAADDLERWKSVVGGYHDVPLMVIDDLGTERSTESGWSINALESLWVDRIDHGYKTVVTTNLNIKQLAQRYGGRLASRLDRPDFAFVASGSVDLRKVKAEYQRRMNGSSKTETAYVPF